tara:strand:- start:4821 stop:6377 length:1557 start_codon:yes stop_codon:yes gene_type:complete
MAIDIFQVPGDSGTTQNKQIPIYWKDRVVYGVEETTDMSAYFKFKFVLEVRLDSSTGDIIAKIKQPWNGYEDSAGVGWRTFFDIRDILASYLSFTTADVNTSYPNLRSIHKVGQTTNDPVKMFSLSNNICKRIAVKAYKEYSTTANGIPEEIITSTDNHRHIWWNATWKRPYDVKPNEYDITANPYDYYFNPGANDKYLYSDVAQGAQVDSRYDFTEMSDSTNAIDLRFNGQGTALTNYLIQFINQHDSATITFSGGDAGSYEVFVRIIEGDEGLSAYDTFLNTTGNGGSGTSNPTTDDKRVVHFGVGPKNLLEQSENTTFDDYFNGTKPWLYYEVCLRNSGGSNTSRTYYFVNGKYAQGNRACNPYNRVSVRRDENTYIRLGWINSLGGWDYFNFAYKNEESFEIQDEVKKRTPSGVFDGEYYDESPTQLTTLSLSKTVKRVMTLNSGYIADGENKLMISLFKSPLIQYVAFGDYETVANVTLNTTSITKQTSHKNGRNVNYTFDIEFENKEPVVAR